MAKRNHLKRLPPEYYQGDAIVHWTMTVSERKQGWLNTVFYYRFRELLAHTLFRYNLACPIFCLMPDHFHMLWMGLSIDADQLLAMKHFRKTCNESLKRIGHELQDQAYDHVLQGEERLEDNFRDTCTYIAKNPERAGLVAQDKFSLYPYTACIIPGYPQLRIFCESFWQEFDRVISYLKSNGLQHTKKPQTHNP